MAFSVTQKLIKAMSMVTVGVQKASKTQLVHHAFVNLSIMTVYFKVHPPRPQISYCIVKSTKVGKKIIP